MENFKNINYIVKHTTRKNSIAMLIGADHVEIRAPKGIKEKIILQFINKHYDDIIEKLNNNVSFIREYCEDEQFHINGDEYTLNIHISDKNFVNAEFGKLNVYTKTGDVTEVEKLVKQYYKKLALLDANYLVNKFSKIMGLKPNQVKVNFASKRWGSCNHYSKNLNFTARIAMLDDNAKEYIIIHELCHLIHPDHSQNFWNEVAKYCPDYKTCENTLTKFKQAIL